MSYFGVRPYPKPSESLSSYLLRLASLNGIPNITAMLRVLGYSQSSEKTLCHIRPHQLESIADALAPLLKRDAAEVVSTFKNQAGDSLLYKSSRMIQDLRTQHIRICPHCLVSDGYLDFQWSMAHIAHCPKHHSLLLDSCPLCDQPFSLSSELFVGCPHCYHPWSATPLESHKVSSLEMQLWQVLTTPQADHQFLLDVITSTIAIYARPYDSVHQETIRVFHFSEYSHHVSKSYELIFSDKARKHWQRTCFEQRSCLMPLGDKAIYLPINNWLRQLGHYPMSLTPFIADKKSEPLSLLPEYQEFLKPLRLRLTTSVDDRRYQILKRFLRELLPLSSQAFQRFITTHNESIVHQPPQKPVEIIDLKFIASALANKVRHRSAQQIIVEPKSIGLSQHLTNINHLILDVLIDVVEGSLERLDSKRVYISAENYRNWLDVQLKKACSEPISAEKMKRTFGCPNDEFLHYMYTTGAVMDMADAQYQLIKSLQRRIRKSSFG